MSSEASCPICSEEWDSSTRRPLVLACCKSQTGALMGVCATCIQAWMEKGSKCFFCPMRMQNGRGENEFIAKCELATPSDILEILRKRGGESSTLPKPQPAGGQLTDELKLLSEPAEDAAYARIVAKEAEEERENENNSVRVREEEDRKLAERIQREFAQEERAAAAAAPAVAAPKRPPPPPLPPGQMTMHQSLEQQILEKKARTVTDRPMVVVDLTKDDDDEDDDDDDRGGKQHVVDLTGS